MKSYNFKKKLSDNKFTQTWYVLDPEENEKILKFPSENPDLNVLEINRLLRNSYPLQRELYTRSINRPLGKYYNKNTFYIEYPYLTRETWQELTPELFWKNFPESLVQVCLITDYIHQMRKIHFDLKLENFQINVKADELQIVLTDLEFISPVSRLREALILGTPQYIAPEILQNDYVSVSTDNYSLGKSLAFFLDEYFKSKKRVTAGDKINKEQTQNLISEMTREIASYRPVYLSKKLEELGIIDHIRFENIQKKLLFMQLTTWLNLNRSCFRNGPKKLQEYLKTENGVFGIPDKFLDDLENNSAPRNMILIKLFKDLFDNTKSQNLGNFWFMECDDSFLLKLYDRYKINGNKPSDFHWYLKEKEDFLEYSSNVNSEKYIKFGNLAGSFNRQQEAFRLYQNSLQNGPKKATKEKLQIYAWIINHLIRSHQYFKTEKFIDLAVKTARELKEYDAEIDFLRQRANILNVQGREEESYKMLTELLEKAKKHKLPTQIVKNTNALGVFVHRQGDLKRAEKLYREAEKLAKEHNLTEELTLVNINLCQIYSERMKYKKAISYGKKNIKLLKDKPEKCYKLLTTYRNMTYSLIRLGEFNKAEYWLNQYINDKSITLDVNAMIEYYHIRGWLEGQEGDFDSARENLNRVLELGQTWEHQLFTSKAIMLLGELAFYQGRVADADSFLDRALSEFTKYTDREGQGETRLIRLLVDRIYNDEDNNDKILATLRNLMELGTGYYSLIALFYLYIFGDEQILPEVLKITQAIEKEVGKIDSFPLGKTIKYLKDFYINQAEEPAPNISLIKEAYIILEQSGQYFMAMLLSKFIGECHIRFSHNKLSQRFFENTISQAAKIKNLTLEEKFKQYLDQVTDPNEKADSICESVMEISNLITTFDDYKSALNRMIEYAVKITGAERGVLLLREPDSDKLRVRAYINCDKNSLIEIEDFSHSITNEVFEKVSPLIINDALNDDRMKHYRSIAVHNIRSVICLPVELKNHAHGVLYLDHHTIPALFDESDIKYVTSLSNFISVVINHVQEVRNTRIEIRELKHDISGKGKPTQFITKNPTLLDLLDKLPNIAMTNASILIQGESGTGKEIISEMIHDLSYRKNAPMIKLNCAAIAESLIESELFGVADRVATGVDGRMGKIESADGGTLLLDEVGDLPLHIQAKFLRVVDSKEFQKLGSNRNIYVDVRYISATNKDLETMVAEGNFRNDLFYRLNTVLLVIPPLCERPEDIEPLISYFLDLFSVKKESKPVLSKELLSTLINYKWPGNVRELRNLCEQFTILFPNQEIKMKHLPDRIRGITPKKKLTTAELKERQKMKEALDKHNGNIAAAARELGMSYTTFRRKMGRNGLDDE